jgi:hypothetical protein
MYSSTLEMTPAHSSETSVNIYHTEDFCRLRRKAIQCGGSQSTFRRNICRLHLHGWRVSQPISREQEELATRGTSQKVTLHSNRCDNHKFRIHHIMWRQQGLSSSPLRHSASKGLFSGHSICGGMLSTYVYLFWGRVCMTFRPLPRMA